jgi:hypothetical protein
MILLPLWGYYHKMITWRWNNCTSKKNKGTKRYNQFNTNTICGILTKKLLTQWKYEENKSIFRFNLLDIYNVPMNIRC